MSSSWSEIRSRAGNDPLVDAVSDLQAKQNANEAQENIITSDKISPIRILRSKVEVDDRKMMTGYTRPRDPSNIYQMPLEPDGNHLRLQLKFDSGCGELSDYSMMENKATVEFQDQLPILLKGTEDDGITAGDIVTVLDGKTQCHRVEKNPAISIKKMVQDGKPGITIIYRHFPLLINNERDTNNQQRATPFYFIENDQVEYACKAQIDDAGFIYFFFRHNYIDYKVKTTTSHLPPFDVPDYKEQDYNPEDYEAAEDYYSITFPTAYIDLAFQFNFTTKAINLFKNGIPLAITTTAINIVPPAPTPVFPLSFPEPPPPPPEPEPYFLPFEKVYEQLSVTGSEKINAVTTTRQIAVYHVEGSAPQTDPILRIYQVSPPPESRYENINPDDGTGGIVNHEPITPSLNNTARYLGGMVYSAPRVYFIFDGFEWDTVLTPYTKAQVIDKIESVLNSTYFDALIQYKVRRPRDWKFVTNTFMSMPNNYTHTDVQALVEDCKTRNLVPSHIPTENKNIYIVIGGPNKTFASIVNPAGTIQSYWTNNSDMDHTITVKGVVAWNAVIDKLTRKATSMLVAMMVDPYENPTTGVRGWRKWPENSAITAIPGEDPTDPVGVEINNVTVDRYWSAVDNGPIPPPNAPSWVSCPVNTQWNNDSQFCVGALINSSSEPSNAAGTSIGSITSTDNSSAVLRANSPDNERVANVILSSSSGLGAAAVGKKITQMIVPLRAENTPVGPMYGVIWDAEGEVKGVLGQAISSNVGTDWTMVTFTGEGGATVAVGDRIGVMYRSGESNDIIRVRRRSTNLTDTSVRQSTLDYGNDPDEWDQNSSFIIAMELFAGSGGTGTPGTPPPATEPFVSDFPLANDTALASPYVGQLLGTGSDVISKIPTILEVMLWRNSLAISGTYLIALWDKNMKHKKTFIEGQVADLPNTIPTHFNIVWQDVFNNVPIEANDSLLIQVTGITHPARVFTMTNRGYRGELVGGQNVPNPDQRPLVTNPIIPDKGTGTVMKYWGGNTISGAVFHLIFWGNSWNTQTSPFTKDDIIANQKAIVAHKFYDANIQYNNTKRPTWGKSAVNTTYPDYSNWSRQDLLNVVVDSIKRGLVPPQTADNRQIYMVVPGRNKHPSGASNENIGGYHTFGMMPGEKTISTLNKTPSQYVYLIFGWSRHYNQDGINYVLSHEWEEAITDPRPTWQTLGVYSRITNPGPTRLTGEISDVCQNVYGHDWGTEKYHGITTNPYWSNQDIKENGDACVFPDSKPSWIACPDGYSWNDTTQQCESKPPGTIIINGYNSNDFDGENSHIIHNNIASNVADYNKIVDLVMRLRIGGGEFIGYIELNNIRQRAGIKVNHVDSVLVDIIPSKLEFTVKRIGPQLSPSNLACNIRDAVGTVVAAMGVYDASLINLTNTPVVFSNPQNTYKLKAGDTISLEYGNATETNYLLVRLSKGTFNAGNASKTMLFESTVPLLNNTRTLHDLDIAGTVYTGGVKDLEARPMRGVKVNSVNSVLYDKVITEVRVKLQATGTLDLGKYIRVKIIRGLDKVVMKTLGLLDFNSLSQATFTEFYFVETDNTYRMKVGDMVAVEFNHGNGDDQFIEIRTSTGNVYDANNTIMFEYNGKNYLDVPGKDLSGSMSIGGYTVYPDPAVPTPIPPSHYSHEWFIGAATTPDSNSETEPSNLKPLSNSYYNTISKEFRIYDMLLTEDQLTYYYENRFTITPIPKGKIEVVGHDIVPISSS